MQHVNVLFRPTTGYVGAAAAEGHGHVLEILMLWFFVSSCLPR